MAVSNIIVFLATVTAVSSSCTSGNCEVDDTTSFIQYKQTITSADERRGDEIDDDTTEASSSDNVVFEQYTLEEAEHTTIPTGCEDVGCVGEGPHCDGNELDCTSHGFHVLGYYSSCDKSGANKCETGYKVRCMQCSATATATNAVYPTPAPAPALWVAPTEAPAAAAKAPVAPAVPVMPTDAPVYTPAKFDSYAVGNATLLLKKAELHVKALKVNLTKAKKVVDAVKKNISSFRKKEKEAHAKFESNRKAAVDYSKKRELANITSFKAETSMHSAYHAQHGAQDGAVAWAAKKENYAAQKRYYQKEAVDAHHKTKNAEELVELAKDTVTKAESDLDDAEEAEHHYKEHKEAMNSYKVKITEEGAKAAQDLAVKLAQEHAFKESTPGRKHHEVPPGGGKDW